MVIPASSRTIPRIHLLKSAARKLDDIYDLQLDIGFTYNKCTVAIITLYCRYVFAVSKTIQFSFDRVII